MYELALAFPESSPLSPLTGYVFYVGKGTKNRLETHEAETRLKMVGKNRRYKRGQGQYEHKHKVILFAWDNGGSILKNKVATNRTEDEAFEIEAERINLYGLEHLTNVALPRKRRTRT